MAKKQATLTTESLNEMTSGAVNEVHEAWQQSDALLKELATADRQPTWSELVWFQQKMDWDQRKVAMQISRRKQVENAKLVAGSEEDRKQLAAAAEAAQKDSVKQTEKLQSQIEKLQSDLRAVETNCSHLNRRNEEAQAAVRRLRSDLLPDHVEKTVHKQIGVLKNFFMPTIHELETNIHQRHVWMTQPAAGNDQHWGDSLKKANPAWVSDRGQLTPSYYAAFDELRALNAADQEKVDQLRAEFEAEKALLEVGKHFYL